MNYLEKYLEYKKKYIDLKKQHGSGIHSDKIIEALNKINPLIIKNMVNLSRDKSSMAVKMLQKIFDKNISPFLNKVIDDPEKLNESDKELLRNNNNMKEIINSMGRVFDNPGFKIEQNSPLVLLYYKLTNKVIKRSCNVHDFMTIENPGKICNNPTLVQGSCSEPEFFKNINVINDNNDKIIKFLDYITKININKKPIYIILGSRNIDSKYKHNINITFDAARNDNAHDIDYYLKLCEKNECNDIKYFHIDNKFPLNTAGSNINVLKKILEMTDSFQVNLINKMCGTCHRSLYYLVQNATQNFTYQVNPEQGTSVADTIDIKNCFINYGK